MKNIFIVPAMLILFTTIGCSSGGSNGGTNSDASSSSSSGGVSKTGVFDNIYSLRATPNTTTANDGGDCSDSTAGTMIITNSVITGTAITSDGDTYVLNGSVDTEGMVTGGYAYDGDDVVSYTGIITGQSGSGIWGDLYECSGEWWISLKSE